jgi:hypothetical protein
MMRVKRQIIGTLDLVMLWQAIRKRPTLGIVAVIAILKQARAA